MTNNEYTHFQDVYPLPTQRRSVQQPLGGVGQDKGAHSRARIASLPTKQTQPQTKNNTSHSLGKACSQGRIRADSRA